MKLSLLYESKEIEMKRFELLDYEAFVLCCCILLVETITLIMFGFNYGKDCTFLTFSFFVLVDFVVCALACTLKVIEEK